MTKKEQEELKRVMSRLGKQSYLKSPRTKEEYSEMGVKSGKARRKKLSTPPPFDSPRSVATMKTH